MQIEHLVAFNLALAAAIASPGPAFLIAVRTTLCQGRRAGIAIGLGLGVMAAFWTLMALLGLDLVFELFPSAYVAARFIGAAYLLHVAWTLWTSADEPLEADRRPTAHAFGQGLLVNLLNPKSVLFAAAVLLVVFPADMTPLENAIVVLNHLVVELLFYTGLALAMSGPAFSRRYLAARGHIDRLAAGALGALGLRLLLRD